MVDSPASPDQVVTIHVVKHWRRGLPLSSRCFLLPRSDLPFVVHRKQGEIVVATLNFAQIPCSLLSIARRQLGACIAFLDKFSDFYIDCAASFFLLVSLVACGGGRSIRLANTVIVRPEMIDFRT